VLRASLEKPELSCSGCLFATPPARRPGLTRSAALGLAVRADIHWLLDGIPPDEEALPPAPLRVLDGRGTDDGKVLTT